MAAKDRYIVLETGVSEEKKERENTDGEDHAYDNSKSRRNGRKD